MSHVDDGFLHALLDGALAAADPAEAERVELHIAACSDCRARLDEAGRVREEAGALLASARPRAVAAPPFETIRARAHALEAGSASAVQPRSRRGASWATPFGSAAWAATVVLAVGLGWLLHDTVEQPERIAIPESAERTAADAAIAPADEAPIPAAATTSDFSAAGTGVGAERVATDARERRLDPDVAGTTSAPEYPVAESDRSQEFQSLEPPPPPAPAPSQRADARAAEYAVAEEAAIGAASGIDVADAAAEAPPLAAAPAAAAADGWRQTTVAEATREAGALVRLDDAEVVSAATRNSGSALEVRTVQMTRRGEMLTVVQRPLAADRRLRAQRAEAAQAAAAADAPAAESSVPVVTVQVGDWIVTISGPVARERIEQLADGLR